MKRNVFLLFALVLSICTSCGTKYKCRECTRNSPDEKITVYGKIYVPKSYDKAENTIDFVTEEMLNGIRKRTILNSLNSKTIYFSDIHIGNGKLYRIGFMDVRSPYPLVDKFTTFVLVSKSSDFLPMERIYEQEHHDFNSAYADYERLCKEYLDMM